MGCEKFMLGVLFCHGFVKKNGRGVNMVTVAFFHKKYNKNFDEFEKMLRADDENFTHYDDYMEWKAYKHYLDSIDLRIKDLRNRSALLRDSVDPATPVMPRP